MYKPFYDPHKMYQENYDKGPFGEFARDTKMKQKGQPSYTFLGQQVYLPFGIPAGPLLNSSFVSAALRKGFNICVYKTVRTRKYPCHPWPNVLAVHPEGELTLEKAQHPLYADQEYTAPLSITNSFGVPSMDPDVWQVDMKKAVAAQGKGQVVIGSFQGTSDGSGDVQKYIEDFVLAARLVKETGVPILEANLSCPNEGTAHLLCFDIDRTQQIATRIKDEVGNTPLILKLAYFADQKMLETLVNKLGSIVDGLAVINTIAAPIIDKEGNPALPGKGRERSGVCGASIKWAGQEMVQRLQKLRAAKQLQFAIIGGGGVVHPQDYQEYRELGADAVMSATGAMWNPFLAEEIAKMEKITKEL